MLSYHHADQQCSTEFNEWGRQLADRRAAFGNHFDSHEFNNRLFQLSIQKISFS